MGAAPSKRGKTGEGTAGNRRMSGLVLAIGMFGVILGSTIPSGLYAVYEERMGFAESTTTVFFACYVVGVIAALVAGGHLADQIGRRPVILASLVLSIASSAVLATAGPLWLLCVGRILSGASVGLCTGAFTAALTETIGQRTGAITSTAITSLALAAGPMFSTALLPLVQSPLRTPYITYGIVGVVVLVVTLRVIGETGERAKHPDWRPRVGVPSGMWLVFVPFALSIACAYGTNGLFQSVVPLAMPGIGVESQAAMAAATSLMLATSAVVQIAAAGWHGRGVLMGGLGILALGLVGTATGLVIGSAVLFWAATIVAGVGQGLSFRASLYLLTEMAPSGHVAQTVSSYYIVGYAATAVPPLAAAFAGGGAVIVAVVCAVVAAVALGTAGIVRAVVNGGR